MIPYVENMVKNLIFHLIFTLLGSRAIAQGGVDIEYFSIDSITNSLIGKEIRIDFKSLEKEELSYPASTFSTIFGDTFSLKIKDQTVIFTEKWVYYIDEKLLRNQSCRSRNLHRDIQIHEIILERIDDTSITANATIYDVDSTYVELDQKRIALQREIDKIKDEIAELEHRNAGGSDTTEALSQKVRELKREIRRLDRKEERVKLDWIKRNKKCTVEQLVIKKSLIDGILVKME